MYSNSNAYLQNGEDVNLKNDLLIFISHQNLLSLNTNLILNEIQQIFEEMLLAILMCKLNWSKSRQTDNSVDKRKMRPKLLSLSFSHFLYYVLVYTFCFSIFIFSLIVLVRTNSFCKIHSLLSSRFVPCAFLVSLFPTTFLF